MNPRRILAVTIGAVVLLAIVAGVVSATRPSPDFESGSPEAAVQGFLQAVIDGDEEEAVGHLASESECDLEDIRRAREVEPSRVVLVSSEVDGDTARVRVGVVHGGGGLLDVEEYRQEHTFDLIREGDDWRVTGEPWPLFSCRRGD